MLSPRGSVQLPLLRCSRHDIKAALPAGRHGLAAAVASQIRLSSSSSQRRHLHSSEKRTSTLAGLPIPDSQPPMMTPPVNRAPLAVLPLSMILRSLMTNTVSSSPTLLPPSLRLMGALARTHNPILNPDKNPILRYAIKKSFYAQFCAGETSPEVSNTIDRLKHIGFNGVILCYAKEVVLSAQQSKALAAGGVIEETEDRVRDEVMPWTQGVLETVRLTQPGDYVALKFTGAGSVALYRLSKRLSPSPVLSQSIDSICQLARQRGVRLLFDAEQDSLQDGIDDWTIEYARKYNNNPNAATIYGTYQAYKKCMPEVVSQHLALAQKEGFTLGVKLVRGAYLHTDPRHRLHDTKADTDKCYDSIASSVLKRQWSAAVNGSGEYPAAHVMLATHNLESVRYARAICEAGEAKSGVAFAQLQGMADEVSCELVEASQSKQSVGALELPVYKYVVWGSTGECMKYLLRRAEENKDAVQRTLSGRNAMWTELVRRCKQTIGLA